MVEYKRIAPSTVNIRHVTKAIRTSSKAGQMYFIQDIELALLKLKKQILTEQLAEQCAKNPPREWN